jgi:excisionase family DNA binding protein
MNATRESEMRLLDTTEVAEMMRVSTQTIRRWSRRGEFIAPIRVGPRRHLYREVDVEAFIRRAERGA